MQAPIPSPFETPPTIKTSSQTGNYLVMAGVALICFGAMWFLSGAVGVAPVGVVVMGTYALWSTSATLAVKATGDAIGWRVSSDALPRIRRTISFNMKGAYTLMVSMWPFLAVATMRGEMMWFLPLMLFSVPFSFWSMSVESRFKKMPADEDAAQEYASLVAKWKEARFGLK